MKKTFLSILFALALCLSLAPMALATGGDGSISSFDDLRQGLAGTLPTGGDVTAHDLVLTDNISVDVISSNLTCKGQKSLNLNDCSLIGSGTLTVPDGSKLIVTGSGTVEWYITVESGGTLQLNGGTYSDITVKSGGTLLLEDFNQSATKYLFRTGTEGAYHYAQTFTPDATVVPCPAHNFAAVDGSTDYVCTLCGYVCNHGGHYSSSDNQCEVCRYHCLHSELNESGQCAVCLLQCQAKVTTNGVSQNYPLLLNSSGNNGALNDAPNGSTVTLLRNVTLSVPQTVTDDKTVTLDLNGKTVSGSSITIKQAIREDQGTSLILTDSNATKGSITAALTVNVGGTLTVADTVTLGDVSVISRSKITVNANAKFTSLSISGGTATLNAGTFAALSVDAGETLKDKSFLGTGVGYYGNNKWLTDADLDKDTLSDVSVKPAPIKSVSLTASSTTVAYNTLVTLTATVTQNGNDPIVYTWQEKTDETWTTLKDSTATYQVRPTVGTHTYRCKATADGYTAISNELTVTVNKGTVETIGPEANTSLIYNAQEQELVLALFATLPTGTAVQYKLGENGTWSTEIPKAKNADTYTVYWQVDGGDNYNNLTGTTPVTVTIAPKDIGSMTSTYVSVSQSDLTYTAQPQTPTLTVTLMPRNSETTAAYETLTEDTDYTVTVTPQTNVGDNYQVTITGKGNYTGTMNTSWSINKADHGNQTANGSAKYGASGTVDLSSLIMPGGTASYQSKTDNNSVLSGTPSMDGTTLQFAFVNNSAKIDETAEIKVSVTDCTNYNDYTITVTVTVTDKDVPIVTANDINVTYTGSEIPASAITGTATFNDQTVAGSWSFTNGDTFTTVADSSDSVSVTFTPTDTANFATATATIKVTINQATPTGAPKYTAISTSGKTLADANLTTVDGTFSVEGTVKWVDADGNDLTNTTEVTANTAYKWLFTPTDSDNYTTLSGSITLYRVSTGGSSSTTVTVPVSSDKGSVDVKAEVSKTGTATVEISDKQIEEIAQHGSGTVTVDVSGLKNVESVQVPSHVVETTNKAADTGLTVSLPGGSVALDETALESVSAGKDVTVSVQRVPATDLTEAQQEAVGDMANIGLVVDVDVLVGKEKQSAFNGGKLTVSVPYTPKRGEDTSKLTVWFIRDDGTIENKGGYYDAEKGCFVFETGHLSRYLLVSVDAAFTDVSARAYYAAAVNWAVAQGVTTGISADGFGPDLDCTRAQIVTMLYRAAGSPETAIAADFADVSAEAYYAKAVAWAVENGITDGVGGGKFAPNATCTRAQAVTFLFRYAAVQGMESTTAQELVSGFTDASEVPGYALSAFNWALASGTVQGANGALLPNDTCTRAQIVTMLYRARG